MSGAYPEFIYRKPSVKNLRQGDIAFAEFHQLRARSGDRQGPGPLEETEANLPFLGDPLDYEVKVPTIGGGEEQRILRVWQGYVMILDQNCEMEFASERDSRLVIAPIVSRAQWPEGTWSMMQDNVLPGYFYLPSIPGERLSGVGLSADWPESAVVLASSTLTSVGLVKPRRILGLKTELLPHLQDALARFYAVRGFGGTREMGAIEGKKVIRIEETNRTVMGPSRLLKIYLGETDDQLDDEDEVTVAYWGARP